MTTKKITFRAPEKLWVSFTAQTERAFIKRAPFLDHMIAIELPHVTADLGTFKLSSKARRYIGGLLKPMSKPINIEIREETAAALEETVARHGLVRDALLSRILVFLRGSDALLRFLDMPTEAMQFSPSGKTALQGMPVSAMKAIQEIYDDPLYYIREYLRDKHQCGIYSVALPRSANWAACRLEDKDVPGTRANKQWEREVAEMISEFEREEEALFTPGARPNAETAK